MSKEAMKLALEALKKCHYYMIDAGLPNQSLLIEAFKACSALEEELAKPDFWEGYVPEPVKPATEESSATQAQQALDKKAENARELGLDYEPAQDSGVVTAGGFDPRTQRTWVGLTDEERKLVRNSVGYNQFVTAGEYAEHVQKATEFKLLEKNK